MEATGDGPRNFEPRSSAEISDPEKRTWKGEGSQNENSGIWGSVVGGSRDSRHTSGYRRTTWDLHGSNLENITVKSKEVISNRIAFYPIQNYLENKVFATRPRLPRVFHPRAQGTHPIYFDPPPHHPVIRASGPDPGNSLFPELRQKKKTGKKYVMEFLKPEYTSPPGSGLASQFVIIYHPSPVVMVTGSSPGAPGDSLLKGVRCTAWVRIPKNGMHVCKCIVPVRQEDSLYSHRAANPLVRLVEGEVREEASGHFQGVLPQNWGGTEPKKKSCCHLYACQSYG
ncbi:hypothetical protein TNCV_2859711 [Trichonephila clavipes]|nr:hypothetical protein TNCV_2859711 [Trichonephila clavipes]